MAHDESSSGELRVGLLMASNKTNIKVVVIDNYDSFTYNLVQYIGELGADIEVVRNDKATLRDLESMSPQRLVISPGPGRPDGAGISMSAIRHFESRIPILGVCLGHQAIAQCYGGRIQRAERLMHGKTSMIHHDAKGIYRDLPSPIEATRYHSLIVDPASMPDVLEITSRTQEGEIMGIRHRTHAVEGVQFHPESILTSSGRQLLRNFVVTAESAGLETTAP